MSALLGASGNSPDYAEALDTIGAMDAGDDIYAAFVFCPIANLEIGDAAYEWLHAQEIKNGANPIASGYTELDEQLHKALITSYETYLQEELGLDLEQFKSDWRTLFEDSLNYYVETYEDGNAAGFAAADESGVLAAEDGTVKLADGDPSAFVAAYMTRRKGTAAIDPLNRSSSEAPLFDGIHFS